MMRLMLSLTSTSACAPSETHLTEPAFAVAREGAGALLRLRGYQADGGALLNDRRGPSLPQLGLRLRVCALCG